MSSGLYRRIKELLEERNLSEDALDDFLLDHNVKFKFVYLELFGEPKDICIIAGFLGVSASSLLERTHFLDAFVRSVFEENWVHYEGKLSISKEQAWNKVVNGREFKGQSESLEAVRKDIAFILEGLVPRNHSNSSCNYPDCDCDAYLRCQVTGWQLGPED